MCITVPDYYIVCHNIYFSPEHIIKNSVIGYSVKDPITKKASARAESYSLVASCVGGRR